MSSIIFHAQFGEERRVRGPEVFYALGLFPKFANVLIGAEAPFPGPNTPKRFTTYGSDDNENCRMLNEIIRLGSDHLILMARITGQAPIHGWIDGPDLNWFADLIEAARRAEILRPEMGWEEVAAWLREIQPQPVVLSYSGNDNFPGGGLLRPEGMDWEQWGDFTTEEQWEICLRALREETQQEDAGTLTGGDSRQIRPGNWKTYKFI